MSSVPFTQDSQLASQVRHSEYYFEDGNVIVVVEGTLYNLHRFQFKESSVWRGMFSLDPGPGNVVEGMSDDKPILLDSSLNSVEFDGFLRFIYTPKQRFDGFKDVKELETVLRFADMWDFQDILTYAKNKLRQMSSSLDVLKRLELGRKYHLDDMVLDAYVILCCRPDTLDVSVCEAMVPFLGYEKFLELLKARELVRHRLENLVRDSGRTPQDGRRPVTVRTYPCLYSAQPCHKDGVFLTPLSDLLSMPPASTAGMALEDAIIVTIPKSNSWCSHCAPRAPDRIRSWLDMIAIRSIVKGIMDPIVKTEKEECGSSAVGRQVIYTTAQGQQLEGNWI